MAYKNTKWMKLFLQWKEFILNGTWASGSRLPALIDLAGEYGISYLTAQKIIRKLADENLVNIIHSRGIFVADQEDRLCRDNACRLLLNMFTRGDFFGDVFEAMCDSLPERMEKELFAPATRGNAPDQQLEQIFSLVKNDNRYRSLCMYGNDKINYNLLKKYMPLPCQLNFLFYDFSAGTFPEANRILCDFSAGAEQAAAHLLSEGFEHLVLLTKNDLPAEYAKYLGIKTGITRMFSTGIELACRRAGVDFSRSTTIIRRDIYGSGNENNIREIMDILSGTRKKCGFIAISDNRTVSLYQAADRLNLKIGQDVGVVGCYNTPTFTRLLSPGLSSIHFDENFIGQSVANLISSDARGREIRVAPQLIVRSSTSSAGKTDDSIRKKYFDMDYAQNL